MNYPRTTLELVFGRPGDALEDAVARAVAERGPETASDVLMRSMSVIDGTAGLIGRLARALPELPEAHREDVAQALAELADSIAIAAAVAEGARIDFKNPSRPAAGNAETRFQ